MTKEEILNKKFKMESSDHDTKVFMYDALDAMEEYVNIKADQSVIDEATKLSIHALKDALFMRNQMIQSLDKEIVSLRDELVKLYGEYQDVERKYKECLINSVC